MNVSATNASQGQVTASAPVAQATDRTTILTLGIDIGSASSKAVVLKDGKSIVAEAVVQAGTGTSGESKVLAEIFRTSGLAWKDLNFSIGTGYGRYLLKNTNKEMSEITCHGKGVYFLCPKARTVIDIGGQDAKAIGLDDRGDIIRFVMNDKCAAGTGRFLENIARVLETDLKKMAECYHVAKHPAQLSSTCAVFAETEVISLLSNGVDKNDIIAGVHEVIATRACSLALRIGVADDVVVCGGVAMDDGVPDAIAKRLVGHKVYTAPNPQMTGALGAALLAYEHAERDRRAASVADLSGGARCACAKGLSISGSK